MGVDDLVAIAELRDGTPVYENSHIGGLAELMVTFEEGGGPIFTKARATDGGAAGRCGARPRLRADGATGPGDGGAGVDRRRARLRPAWSQRSAGRAYR